MVSTQLKDIFVRVKLDHFRKCLNPPPKQCIPLKIHGFQQNPASHIWKFGTNVGGPTNLWPSQLPRSGHPKSSPKPILQTSRSFHLDSQPEETKQNTQLESNMTIAGKSPFSIGNASLFIVDVPLSCYGG